MIETRAAVLRAAGTPGEPPPFDAFAIEDVSLREPRAGEVLVEVAAACLCHSDLSVMTGHRPRPVPMVLGHEASGRVAAVGPGVSRFAPGDPVLMTYVPRCGHCRPCAEGRPALCEPGGAANAAGELLTGGRPFRDADGELHQHLGLSAFSRHTVVAQESLIGLPDDVPLVEAALLGCAVVTGMGAVANTARVEPGSSVAVFGLGGVGLCAVVGARLAGAAEVIGVDVDERKLALARELGADTALAGGPDVVGEVRERTGGGVDYAFEAAGVAAAFEQAYAVTRRGGTTVAIGLADPAARVPFGPADLVATERVVRGSYMGSTVPERDIPRYVGLLRAGRLPLDRLVGERLTLDDVPAAMRRLHDGVVGRQLIEIGGAG
ncbi:MAG TPA: zinc-binding dehydrogenase [Capillimicrobium sp.]|nr:zinc-binding dehydrogenase [Capillimicrobium sp.]